MNQPLNIFVPHCSGLLTDTLPHGDGLVAHGFISRLAERGHRLYVAAEEVQLCRPLNPNVKLFPIRNQKRGAAAGRLSYIFQVRVLFQRLRAEISFDVIHQLNPVYTGISLALWGCEIPVILGPYVADWPNDPHAISSSRAGLRTLVRRLKNGTAYLQQSSATALLLTTEAALDRVISDEARQTKVYYVPHGIDTEFFSPSPSAKPRARAGDSTVILFLANISERKGIFDLLVAFDALSARLPKAELWIAGAGEGFAAAKELAAQSTAQGQIRFLGRKTREEALHLYRQADIYCLPSHGEPFGMTVLEAMSCGMPVVTTDSGGVSCLVDDQGGVRVPMKRPAALADALAALIEDEASRVRMGQYNRVKVAGRYSWDRVIDELEEVYQVTLRSLGGACRPARMLPTSFAERAPNGGERI